ncbi:uncharacterized protein BDW70DRAFT_171762 [Aspergillus foveolatus]|uniref:uncharacterized protein n=1 Tax=Aspergillus foveolatus TaxID=210207 RepID=UPI003CCD6C33
MAPINEPIAIIGSGCRFPGSASSPSRLWDLLRSPRDCLSEIPKDRFNWEGYHYPDGPHHGSSTTKYTHFLKEDIRRFDPHFFNIQPGEADAIDPQQRLLLETVYEGLESAGLTIESLAGSSTAVYVGMMGCDYADVIQRDVDCTPTYAGTGTARSIHSNRISYFFDWHGPSMTIDTACSSSMMAIHLAMQSLRNGDSNVAVACGANNYVVLSNLNMIAADGRAKMWDASANGYARGEGVGAVILKTLSAAEADGDHIECIIRETSVNQDGRTRGITMPSSTAQADLIRQTYARAGLDLLQRNDRPQYFEAHGTGTMVGDPREAEAVNDAFFESSQDLSKEDQIYIGSIKTVIGHTEGAAGLAGVLKASLALQHGYIPPNLLFSELSPAVAPFAKHLQLATKLTPWPELPEGVPRRASVNSFGFGGSNGHAILEAYTPKKAITSSSSTVSTPFVFSANSERTLGTMLENFVEYIENNPTANLRDIAWTLQHKRSTFGVRTAISARDTTELLSKIKQKLVVDEEKGKAQVGIKSLAKGDVQILGVFTGQGAQWAGMGREILRASSVARETVKKLDEALAQLPEADRPSWSIEEELSKDQETSRIGEAALSQPLCTAVQILLVDMLTAAGLRFSAVVGHSSGEIAAAYTAQFITAVDAIRIAYYRGLYAKLAGGKDGQKGSMMAVGTSLEDAREICALPDFEGRIAVAASNSSTSLTLSGDRDAIEEAKAIFDEEKKFARVLKVDTAYHSHHMQPCAQPYLSVLEACKITPATPDASAPAWFSSVHNGKLISDSSELAGSYWVANMTQPVLFSSALESALTERTALTLALEIGPHPALQAPALQIIQDIKEANIPYTGVLSRGKNDLEIFSDALGFIWTHSERNTVAFGRYDEQFFPADAKPSFVTDLPAYPWDHERSYWFESRTEKLLGVPYGDSTDREVKWRNFLIPKEIPWLSNHQLQGQAVFPAAASAAMAWEAALLQVGGQPVQLIEVENLVIHQAISFKNETTSVEAVLTLSDMVHPAKESSTGTFSANWTVHSPPTPESEKLALVASGSISLVLGTPTAEILPVRGPEPANMVDIDPEYFYGALSELGYGYTGPFQSMTTLRRKLNYSSGTFEAPASDLLIHPALLDLAFQALFAAVSYPGDGGLWSLHVPTSIRGIRVNPYHCGTSDEIAQDLSFDASLAESSSKGTVGDVVIFAEDGHNGLLQVEGVSSVPFTKATAKDDRNIFSEEVWGRADPDGPSVLQGHRATSEEIERAYACERVSHFYLKKLREDISAAEERAAAPHHQCLMAWATNLVSDVASGKREYTKPEWANDTEEEILAIFDRYPEDIDLRIMKSVGQEYPSVVRGQSNPLEHLTKDNMLNEFYTEGLGFQLANTWAARLVKQISHRHAKLNIVEIGAGTGGATQTVLDHLGSAFQSYTYTDVSTAFFEKAQERFKEYAHKMTFKSFDMEKEAKIQDFEEGTFDLVVASNVLHATKDIGLALRHVRSLLRPGGYLVLLEITDQKPSRMGFIMGGLPGWWQGEGRRQWSPTMPPAQWNALLQKTGYSGIDTIASCQDGLPYPFSVSIAQAIDDRITFLRQPLFSSTAGIELGDLLVIGGASLESSKLATTVSRVLGSRFSSVLSYESLEDLHSELFDVRIPQTVLVLVDLDEPIFKEPTATKLETTKTLFRDGRNILWVTQGSKSSDPYANMTIGMGRSVSCEMHELRLQFIDAEAEGEVDAGRLAEMLLRLRVTDAWEKEAGAPLVSQILWTTEPEHRVVEGALLVPRMYEETAQNDRYNSKRRQISTELPLDTARVSLAYSAATQKYRLLSGGPVAASAAAGTVSVRVRSSVLTAIKAADGRFVHVAVGENVATGGTVVALSDSNTSILTVPKELVVPVTIPAGGEKSLALRVAWTLLAQTILSAAKEGNSILARGLQPEFLAVLRSAAASSGKEILTITHDAKAKDPNSLFIHPLSFQNTIKSKIPAGVSALVDFTPEASEDSLHARLAGSIPAFASVLSRGTLFSPESSAQLSQADSSLSELLTKAVSSAQDTAVESALVEQLTHSVRDIPSTNTDEPLQIVDWSSSSQVPVDIEPVDSRITFSADKTYLLIGLTADLGQSLCEWFVRHGARYLVLASRNPRVDQKWLDSFKEAGATVRVIAMDVTDRSSLHAGYAEIKRTLPPIAGVANAAMVLRDIMFSNMKLDDLIPTLRPKVDGSRYLDELFNEADLEFFILFSSLGLIVGNSGQSSYTAANAFMASLAFNRRARGLTAAVMDIGAIIGAGYITRAGQIKAADLEAYGAYPLSTGDFHQMFAEAVLASPADSGRNPEIVTGIRVIDPVVDDRVSWRANPKFSHFWRTDSGFAEGGSGEGKRTAAPVKVQLLDATSKVQARRIIQECFSARLVVLLQLHAEDMDDHTALVELGVDSLVAVEARSWFTKQLGVDIPVLRILGGASVVDLVEDAFEDLAPELLPSVKSDGEEPASVPDKKAQKAPVKTTADSETSGRTSPEAVPLSESVPSVEDSITTPPSTDGDEKSGASDSEAEFTPVVIDVQPMSYAQSRFWFLRHSIEDPTAFNITFSHSLKGDAHPDGLAKAVTTAAQLHQGLRTAFFEQNGQPVQGILETSPLYLERRTIRSEDEVKPAYEKLDRHSYDLESGRTMRILLLELNPRMSYLIVGYHHIAMDGAGFTGFLQELMRIGGGEKMPAPIQYPTYSAEQRASVEKGGMNKELAYWKKTFAQIPPVLPLLPFAKTKSRTTLRSYEFSTTSLRIESVLVARIKRRCRNFQATAFHFYLAVFQTLLFRFLDIDELSIGIADSNRNDAELHRTMGILVNLLPLRFKSKLSNTFGETVKETRRAAYGALENSKLPFNVLLENLNVERSSTHFPIFQVFMDYRPGIQERLKLGDTEVQRLDWSYGKNAYDINLDIMENTEGSAFITFNAQKYLYGQDQVETLMKVYINLLEEFSRDPALRLNEPALFSQSEVQAAIDLARGPSVPSTWPETLPQRVDEIASKNATGVAVKDGDGNQLTYAELQAEISKIAHALIESGVNAGDRVAVFQQPTTTTISTLLAILRVGAVYVPLDLRSPIPRLKAVVADCQPTVLLVHKATAKYATPLANKETNTKIINVSTLAASEAALPANRAVPDANAVILYTSGSTGTPKGVMLTHSGIRNVVEGLASQFDLGAETVLQQSALTFDLSLNQIFVPLTRGGTLFVVPQSKRGDAVEIAQIVKDEGVTYTLATPSEYSYWLRFGADALKSATKWKLAFSLGEELKPRLKEEFRSIERSDLRLINTYGPAEITVMSHAAEIFYQKTEDEESHISAGFSLPNYSFYILDKALKPVPAGFSGEIAIGGAGVALGYLNLDDQTQERFLKDPFASQEWAAKGWNRLYRTGDRGRLRADGALLFEGRIEGSTQIKLRGLRIDLAEIEHALLTAASPALDEAVVTVRGEDEQQFLVAHVVFSRNADIQNPDAYLQQLLTQLTVPQYMIPAMVIPLDRMPLTSHNKTDRKAVAAIPLPKDTPGSAGGESAHLTPLETELVRIWEVVLSQDLLHSGTVSPNLSFFQVGGNSLLLIPLQSLIKDTFHATLAMIDFASAHTVSKMARLIETSATSKTINWEAETAIPADLTLPTLPVGQPVRKSTGSDLNILYTGATGHSGKFILKRLIEDPRISKIFLVAVRTTDENPTFPRKLTVESEKLIQFPGNLLEERLGLSDEDYSYLAANTDVILHSAANRSLWDNYQVLRHPSVIATQTLVALAAPRKIPFHFMSSAAIHLFDKNTTTTSVYPETIATAQPPVDGSEGYLASKWAVEKLLENANGKFSIPVYFHRPGPIPPDGKQTVDQDTVFGEFLRVVRELRMHVTRESIKGHIDLIVLDELALALRDQLISSVEDSNSVGRFLHHYSNARVQMGEWKAYMDKHNTTLTLDMVEFEHAVEWVGRAKKIGFPYMLAAQDFDMSGVMSSLPIIQRR